VAAGGGTATVDITFTPTGADGAVSGTLDIASDDPTNATVSVDLGGTVTHTPKPAISAAPIPLAFGSCNIASPAVSLPITITNNGDAVLTLGTIGLHAGSSSMFTIASSPASGATVAASGGTATVSITFTPTGADGAVSGTLDIASNDPVNGTISVSLTGSVTHTPKPKAEISALVLTFTGSRAVDVEKNGQPTTQTLTLTNSGDAPLTFTGGDAGTPGLALNGVNAAQFQIAQVTPSTSSPLAGGASLQIVIKFAPQMTQRTLDLTASLVITTNDAAHSPLTVVLSGDAVPVELSAFKID
jgi:hypothetical protein